LIELALLRVHFSKINQTLRRLLIFSRRTFFYLQRFLQERLCFRKAPLHGIQVREFFDNANVLGRIGVIRQSLLQQRFRFAVLPLILIQRRKTEKRIDRKRLGFLIVLLYFVFENGKRQRKILRSFIILVEMTLHVRENIEVVREFGLRHILFVVDFDQLVQNRFGLRALSLCLICFREFAQGQTEALRVLLLRRFVGLLAIGFERLQRRRELAFRFLVIALRHRCIRGIHQRLPKQLLCAAREPLQH
jgi:hypothetical protein